MADGRGLLRPTANGERRTANDYDFHLIAPFHMDFFGVSLGLPNTLSFERSSIFPMTDLELP